MSAEADKMSEAKMKLEVQDAVGEELDQKDFITYREDNVPGDEGGEGEGGGDEAAEKVDATKYVPITRFNEVYGQSKDFERMAKAYQTYGKPEDLKSRLDKLAQWEKAVEESRAKAGQSDEEKTAADRAARVRRELMAIFPELGKLAKIEELEKGYGELRGTSEETAASAMLAEHSKSFTKILSAAHIDPKYQSDIEEYIVAKMSDEEKLAFVRGDFGVAKTMFDGLLKAGGMLTTLVKKQPPIPPALHNTPGGTNLQGGKKTKIGMKEALDLGWARMHDGEE
jgi:hypothetical protein